MVSQTIRAFFAIKLPGHILIKIEKEVVNLRKTISEYVKWLSTDSIHLTLKFIGSFSPNHIPMLQTTLEKQLKDYGTLNLSIGMVGAFPNLRNPRTIWLGLNEFEKMRGLVRILDEVGAEYGYGSEKRDFSPHLTIGRVKNSTPKNLRVEIGKIISNYKLATIEPCSIDKIRFIKSKLAQQGAIYSTIFEINL